jgi:hypothetical protein
MVENLRKKGGEIGKLLKQKWQRPFIVPRSHSKRKIALSFLDCQDGSLNSVIANY